MDQNADGKLDAEDASWDDILVWRDIDVDGQSDLGEIGSLGQYDISGIALGIDGDSEDSDTDQVSAHVVGSILRSSGEDWLMSEVEFHQVDFAHTGIG